MCIQDSRLRCPKCLKVSELISYSKGNSVVSYVIRCTECKLEGTVTMQEEPKEYRYKAICLSCSFVDVVRLKSKQDYEELMSCPKCEGAFVDVYKVDKYKPKEIKVHINSSESDVDKFVESVKKALASINGGY